MAIVKTKIRIEYPLNVDTVNLFISYRDIKLIRDFSNFIGF